jgi:hypothetical protein
MFRIIGGMTLAMGTPEYTGKPVSVPLGPSQISHGLAQH